MAEKKDKAAKEEIKEVKKELRSFEDHLINAGGDIQKALKSLYEQGK